MTQTTPPTSVDPDDAETRVGAFRFSQDVVELVDDGRRDGPLDPDIQMYLGMLPPDEGKRPPSGAWAVKLARRNGRRSAQMMAPPPEQLAEVRDLVVSASPANPGDHDVPTRVYRPTSDPGLPVLVFVHGGAFVMGDLDSCDSMCRLLAKRARAVVVSVDYRLAPEDPFPAGVHDVHNVVRWVQQHAEAVGGDPARVCLVGDSAGASLVAATTLLARDRSEPAADFQVLVNPTTDHALETPSAQQFATGYLITVPFIEVAWDHYVPEPANRDNPLASPLRASDHSGLPSALVVTAGHDPLRDEGEAYGERLHAAGVDVMIRRHQGAVHGWFTVPHVVASSKLAWDEVTAVLRHRYHGSPEPLAADASGAA